MTRPRINFANTDAAFCEKVTRIAQAQGWKLDLMDTRLGISIAFERVGCPRVASDIFKDKQSALVDACKRLLPEIYEHL